MRRHHGVVARRLAALLAGLDGAGGLLAGALEGVRGVGERSLEGGVDNLGDGVEVRLFYFFCG